MDDTERTDSAAVSTLTFNLIVLMNLVVKPFNAVFGVENDLSLSEWRCMMWLAAHPGASGQDTANGIGMDRMNVSRSLRSMKSKDYTRRLPGVDDKKKWLWFLTDDGWAVYDRIIASAIDRDHTLVKSLDPAEREIVLRFLETATAELRALDP